jgi:hypothetical protein
MATETKVKWAIVWVVLSPLIVLSWVAAILTLPFKKATDFINKLCSPWG